MSRLLITFGGSRRKYNRTLQAFSDAEIELRDAGPVNLGSKLRHGIVSDTPEARKLLKQMGGSVARRQWTWLKDAN